MSHRNWRVSHTPGLLGIVTRLWAELYTESRDENVSKYWSGFSFQCVTLQPRSHSLFPVPSNPDES